MGNAVPTALTRNCRAKVHQAKPLNGRRGTSEAHTQHACASTKIDQYGGKSTFARELEEAAAEEPPEVEESSRPWSSAPPHPTKIIRLTVLGLYKVKSGKEKLGKTHTP